MVYIRVTIKTKKMIKYTILISYQVMAFNDSEALTIAENDVYAMDMTKDNRPKLVEIIKHENHLETKTIYGGTN